MSKPSVDLDPLAIKWAIRLMKIGRFLRKVSFAIFLMSLTGALLVSIPTVRRNFVLPFLWSVFTHILFSSDITTHVIEREGGVPVTIQVEHGQEDRLDMIQKTLDEAVAHVEDTWEPFQKPIHVRLVSGLSLFGHYQANIMSLPGAFAMYDTLFIISYDQRSTVPDTEPLEIRTEDGEVHTIESAAVKSRRSMLAHELTHLRMYELISPDAQPGLPFEVPQWFLEGMAEFTDGERPKKGPSMLMRFHRDYPEINMGNPSHVVFNRSMPFAYGISYHLFTEFVRKHGRTGVQDIFAYMRDGETFERAIGLVVGEPEAVLEAQMAHVLFETPDWYNVSRDWIMANRSAQEVRRMCDQLTPEDRAQPWFHDQCITGLQNMTEQYDWLTLRVNELAAEKPREFTVLDDQLDFARPIPSWEQTPEFLQSEYLPLDYSLSWGYDNRPLLHPLASR